MNSTILCRGGHCAITGTPPALLPLIRDLDRFVTQLQSRSILLRSYGSLFRFVLYKCDATTTRNQSDLSETIETPEYAGQSLDVVLLGEVLNE